MLNKIDLLPPEDVDAYCKKIVRQLKWKGPVFKISGLSQQGLQELAQAAMNYLEEDRMLDASEARVEE